MADLVQYGGNDTTRPTGAMWSDCQVHGDFDDIYHHFSDFINCGIVADTSIDGWTLLGTNPDLSNLATVGNDGVIVLGASGGADNDDAYLISNPFGSIVLGSGRKVWIEGYFAASSIADQGIVFGLGEAAFLVTDAVVDAATNLITESFVGFRVYSGTPAGMDFVYQLDDGAEVEPIAAATQTLVAGTYYKFGFKFNGQNSISVWIDGVKVGSMTIPAATFPVGVNMGAIIGLKTGEAAAKDLYIDWLRIAAEKF